MTRITDRTKRIVQSREQIEYDSIMHGWLFAETVELGRRLELAKPILVKIPRDDIRHRSHELIRQQYERDHKPPMRGSKRKTRGES